MNEVKKTALIEGVKEFGRVVVIGAVSAGIVYLQALAGGIQDVALQVALLSLLTSVGKAVDKFVHKNDNINANGIVPF